MSQAKKNELEQGIEIAPGVKYGGTEQLATDKIEARMRLLAMPPEAAQRIVEQTLYPQHWDVRPEDIKWEESIPTNYGEDNDEAEANA
jgi:hypothetical protein